MRKLALYISSFLLSLIVCLYISFPIQEKVEGLFSKHGISYSNIDVEHLPHIKFTVENPRIPSIPIRISKAEIEPNLLSLLSNSKKLETKLYTCNGTIDTTFDFPVTHLQFQVESLSAKEMLKNLKEIPFSLNANLSGNGNLFLEKVNIKSGSGKFSIKNLELRNISFGIFSIKDANFGDGNLIYKVIGKNFASVSLKTSGNDGNLNMQGGVTINPKKPEHSYLNLKVTVLMKLGKLKSHRFSFNIRGYVKNLEVM